MRNWLRFCSLTPFRQGIITLPCLFLLLGRSSTSTSRLETVWRIGAIFRCCGISFPRKLILEHLDAIGDHLAKKRNPDSRYRDNGRKGAAGEARVCADLLDKGYDVFRAVNPNSSCDIIALKNGKLLRVESRTATVNVTKTGKRTVYLGNKTGVHDVLAGVDGNTIFYDPVLEDR